MKTEIFLNNLPADEFVEICDEYGINRFYIPAVSACGLLRTYGAYDNVSFETCDARRASLFFESDTSTARFDGVSSINIFTDHSIDIDALKTLCKKTGFILDGEESAEYLLPEYTIDIDCVSPDEEKHSFRIRAE